MLIYVWACVIAFALIIEFLTNELFSFWFACGGVVALICAIFGVEWYFQLIAFAVFSAGTLLLFRKMILSKIRVDELQAQADVSIGKSFVLLTPITFNQCGTIKIDDVSWNVATDEPIEIQAGEMVKVVEFRSNKYIVHKEVDRE